MREKSVILNNLELFALCLIANSDVFALEDLGTKCAFAQVALQLCLSLSSLCGILDDKVTDLLHDFVLFLCTALFSVIDIFELI